MSIAVKQLQKRFGQFTALDNVSLEFPDGELTALLDRKSTRLNSSHVSISYAGFCLKKKNRAATSATLHRRTPGRNPSRGQHRCCPGTGCPLLRFLFNDPATTEIYSLSLHDALPI